MNRKGNPKERDCGLEQNNLTPALFQGVGPCQQASHLAFVLDSVSSLALSHIPHLYPFCMTKTGDAQVSSSSPFGPKVALRRASSSASPGEKVCHNVS
jgi:hypothetical protein